MIAEFGLAVALWIILGGESAGNLLFGIEACHLFAGELCPVVGNDGVREPKATYNVLQRNLTTCCFVTLESDTAFIHLVK